MDKGLSKATKVGYPQNALAEISFLCLEKGSFEGHVFSGNQQTCVLWHIM